MKKHLHIIVFALCLVMFLCLCPARADAAEVIASGSCGTDDVWWTLTDDGVFTVSGRGDMIGTQWYNIREKIKTAVIEDGVTAICGSAFNDCTSLTDVRIANSVTSIGMGAFNGCTSLKCITIPGKVTYIGNGAFSGCTALKSVTIPNSVKTIDGYAFARCSALTDIVIPDSVTEIGGNAFESCSSLKSVKISENAVSIGNNAFRGCISLTDAVIPGSVRSLGDFAFYYCPSLKSVAFSEGIESVGDYAFSDCDSLKSVTLPNSVVSLGTSVFSGCDLLERAVLPEGLTSVEDYTFYGCPALKDVTIPSSVTSVGNLAFGDCASLESITLPDGVKTIGSYAFTGCGALAAVYMPDGVTAIGDHAFNYCTSLSGVTIPSSVTSIGDSSFFYCISITDVTIPENVKSIGERAFYNISGTIVFKGKAPAINGAVFGFDDYRFTYSGVIALYPANDPTWTEAVRKSFGDNLIWIPDNYDTSVTDSPKDPTESLTPTESLNIFSHNYNLNQHLNLLSERFKDVHSWADPTDSYLIANGDGSFTRVERIDDKIVIEEYDGSFRLRWKKTVTPELPLWGGFYSGKEFNFFVYGQSNWEENNSKPVVRIVRYTKNWHRVDSVELCGANTVVPFEAGTVRFAESGDLLYIHTCHQMYAAADGINHQANLFITVSVPYMSIIRANYHVGGTGYVSHSFNQFVIADGEDIVRLDHGDAYPRAVTISRFTGNGSDPGETVVLKIYGKNGANATGVSLGGFEASDTCYLVAGNSVVQEQSAYDPSGTRNVFVAATDKSGFGENGATSFRWITSYKNGDGVTVSNPQLVKISGSRFLLIWVETDGSFRSVTRYMYLDGGGDPASDIYSTDCPVSDCQPILSGGRAIWYVTENSAPRFYSISTDGSSAYPKGDVDRNGEVTNSDLILVARCVVSLVVFDAEQLRLGDMNDDGGITNTDIITVARSIVGLN